MLNRRQFANPPKVDRCRQDLLGADGASQRAGFNPNGGPTLTGALGYIDPWMVKFMVVLYRRPDLSKSEFQAFLRDVHGPMAEAIPDLLHYTQNFVAPDPTREDPGWDAIVEPSGPKQDLN